jgi:hypothetical protein
MEAAGIVAFLEKDVARVVFMRPRERADTAVFESVDGIGEGGGDHENRIHALLTAEELEDTKASPRRAPLSSGTSGSSNQRFTSSRSMYAGLAEKHQQVLADKSTLGLLINVRWVC